MFSLAPVLSFLDNPSINWKSIVTSIVVGKFAFESYLKYRQYQVLHHPSPPKALKAEVDLETFHKSQEYVKSKFRFGFIVSVKKLAMTLTTIHFNVFHMCWAFGGTVLSTFVPYLPLSIITSTAVQGLMFIGIQQIIEQISSLPFDYYRTFVLEEKFGFNKYTKPSWIQDTIIQFMIMTIFQGVFFVGLGSIIDYFGESFAIYGTGFLTGVYLLFMTIYPTVIDPLFYKFTPLEPGDLRTDIENLAIVHDFPTKYIQVKHGSSKSSHSNAYVIGLPWNKRIVLYDTLIAQQSQEEVVAITAHEFGHYKHGDTIKLTFYVITDIALTILGGTGFVFNKSLFAAFGFTDTTPGMIGFILFQEVLGVYEVINHFIGNQFVRNIEYAADKYADDLGHKKGLCTGLIKLMGLNLHITDSDWLYATYYENHPNLVERLTALNYVSEQKVSK